MKLKPDQLLPNLKQELRPLYWISGDETLLLQECADQVRTFCTNQGFQEREVFNIDRIFDWDSFRQTTSNLSLFAEKKLIEIRFDISKPDEEGKKALQHYVDSPNPDFVVLITGPRVEGAVLNAKWFKQLDKAMIYISVWPLAIDELPGWLQHRLRSKGIKATPEALQILVDKVEGNLLAAVQEIEKLVLITGPDGDGYDQKPLSLDADTMISMVADSSRYNAFSLVDAALAGDSARTLKIVRGLRDEGAAPLALIGAICSELRRLLPMLEKVQSGQNINAVIQTARVNFKRKQVVASALQRLRPGLVFSLLDQARQVDYAVKGVTPNNPWTELESLLLRMSGHTIPTYGGYLRRTA